MCMLELQNLGCHNINLVTPTHILPQILKSLSLAIPLGLKLPLVYNSGGYELPEVISLLEGIVDIFLVDMRYAENSASSAYSNARDYPEYNRAAILKIQQQVGTAKMNSSGLIEKGLIIRHLLLPNNLSGTEKIMRFIAEEVSAKTFISLMSQYLPCYRANDFPQLNRRIYKNEYALAEQIMQRFKLKNGWMQESRGLSEFAGINIKPLR